MDNIQLLTYNHSNNKFATEKKTIMICEDEPDVLLSFKLVLESMYNIIPVSSGEDCIIKYKEEKSRGNDIHLILLDYRLGDMFGDTVARTIKQYNETKIILISASDLDHALLKELEDGDYIAKYVEKPIYANRLVDLVSDTIS